MLNRLRKRFGLWRLARYFKRRANRQRGDDAPWERQPDGSLTRSATSKDRHELVQAIRQAMRDGEI